MKGEGQTMDGIFFFLQYATRLEALESFFPWVIAECNYFLQMFRLVVGFRFTVQNIPTTPITIIITAIISA